MAAVAGTFAALRSSQLRANAAAPKVSAVQIQQRLRALDRAEAALRVELRRKPPALPAVPHPAPVASVPAAPAPAALASAPAPRVTYVRAKPIIHIVHRHGGEPGDHEGEGGAPSAAGGAGSHFDD